MVRDEVQINVEIPPKLRKQLRVMALVQETTIKALVVKYIKNGLDEDMANNENKPLDLTP